MELFIAETNETIESFLSKDFIPENLRESLSKASVLIFPFENLRDTPIPPFPTGTEDVLRYFQEKLPQELNIDICISDEDYQEFAFNNDYKRIGNFIVKAVAIPAFVTILSSYIYDKYIKEDNTKPQIQIIDKSNNITITNHISTLADKKYLEPTHIKFSVTVIDTAGTSKNINYEGPATEFDTVLKALKEYEK